MSQLDLATHLKELAIPPDFSRYENITDQDALSQLISWRQNATLVLQQLLRAIQSDEADLSLNTKADVVFVCAPFLPDSLTGEESPGPLSDEREAWVSREAQNTAQGIISSTTLSPSRDLIVLVLTRNLKPIFSSSPHPLLHLGTGRRLMKPAGGTMAMQDYYEGQVWKQYPGIDKVVLWCVRNIEADAYESLWHLVIPPVMTLLDDYEPRHKLRGVAIIQQMLQRVPGDLLRRTGVDGLFKQSLRAAMTHLQSPEAPMLLREAIGASISLILLTTSVSVGTKASSTRFDELSSLLGEGIISNVWLYAEDKPEVVKATFDALPDLLLALSVGSVRFFKALIPQLTHVLIPRPLSEPDRNLQFSTIRALRTLVEVGKPRVEPWKETILDAVGRCWVGLVDESMTVQVNNSSTFSSEDIQLREDVKRQLQSLCVKLAEVCPSVLENEYPRFLQIDKALFKELISLDINLAVKS